jgi:hypothetical protein
LEGEEKVICHPTKGLLYLTVGTIAVTKEQETTGIRNVKFG